MKEGIKRRNQYKERKRGRGRETERGIDEE